MGNSQPPQFGRGERVSPLDLQVSSHYIVFYQDVDLVEHIIFRGFDHRGRRTCMRMDIVDDDTGELYNHCKPLRYMIYDTEIYEYTPPPRFRVRAMTAAAA